MSRDTAKAFYDKQAGDPNVGFITASDAKAAIDVMYTDLDTRDTGHRDIHADVVNGQQYDCRLRRWGNVVELTIGVTSYTSAAIVYTLPPGFIPSAGWLVWIAGTTSDQTQIVARSGQGQVLFYGSGGGFGTQVMFLTSDPWPATLPGTPV